MQVKIIYEAVMTLGLIKFSSQSIAGVTYMDAFDFEDRYRDVHECDPLYWHPLHLPEHCAEMFETAIRSRLPRRQALRLVQERTPDFYPSYINTFPLDLSGLRIDSYVPNIALPPPVKIPPSPYDKLFEILRKNVLQQPSSAIVTVMPDLGPVALYKQPVSKKSEKWIKKILTYGVPYVYGFGYNLTQGNSDGERVIKIISYDGKSGESTTTSKPKYPKIKKKKTKHGGTMIIISDKS